MGIFSNLLTVLVLFFGIKEQAKAHKAFAKIKIFYLFLHRKFPHKYKNFFEAVLSRKKAKKQTNIPVRE